MKNLYVAPMSAIVSLETPLMLPVIDGTTGGAVDPTAVSERRLIPNLFE